MKELYERDYSQWAETMADLLSSGLSLIHI